MNTADTIFNVCVKFIKYHRGYAFLLALTFIFITTFKDDIIYKITGTPGGALGAVYEEIQEIHRTSYLAEYTLVLKEMKGVTTYNQVIDKWEYWKKVGWTVQIAVITAIMSIPEATQELEKVLPTPVYQALQAIVK